MSTPAPNALAKAYRSSTHAAPAECPRSALERLVEQKPIFETRPSQAALSRLPSPVAPPSAVFLGVGLATSEGLSRALPLDVLGMLLGAEHVRRAAGARDIVVLLADAHALCNGFSPAEVRPCASAYDSLLRTTIAALGLPRVRFVRASELHARGDYESLHTTICRRAPRGEHAYITREVADIAFFERRYGGLVKVGWALGQRRGDRLDERGFDERFERWVGAPVAFVYCKAGRTLDDRKRKAAPYVTPDPARRLCLSRNERVVDKLELASSATSVATVRGVRRHLKAITRSFRELIGPLDGSVDEQAQQMLDLLLSPRPQSVASLGV